MALGKLSKATLAKLWRSLVIPCSDGANMLKGKERISQMVGPKWGVMYGLGWL